MSQTVLIADDNRSIREVLRELFDGEEDFEVCGDAENGSDAVQRAQKLHPDLIVLDFSMPVMNGMDAARVLNHVMPQVPILMYSAFSDCFIEKEARSAGIWALVSKSEPLSVLLGKARDALESGGLRTGQHLPARTRRWNVAWNIAVHESVNAKEKTVDVTLRFQPR
jgi:two-component system chemotaxis response regulator CheY